jgi:hypothetical protein
MKRYIVEMGEITVEVRVLDALATPDLVYVLGAAQDQLRKHLKDDKEAADLALMDAGFSHLL